MDTLAFAHLIFDSLWIRAIFGLLAANVLIGVATALFNRNVQFYLGMLGDFLLSRAIPYILGWAAVKVVVITAFGDYLVVAQAAEAATSLFVILALLGKILEQLRALGVPIPTWAGDAPTPKVSARP